MLRVKRYSTESRAAMTSVYTSLRPLSLHQTCIFPPTASSPTPGSPTCSPGYPPPKIETSKACCRWHNLRSTPRCGGRALTFDRLECLAPGGHANAQRELRVTGETLAIERPVQLSSAEARMKPQTTHRSIR